MESSDSEELYRDRLPESEEAILLFSSEQSVTQGRKLPVAGKGTEGTIFGTNVEQGIICVPSNQRRTL